MTTRYEVLAIRPDAYRLHFVVVDTVTGEPADTIQFLTREAANDHAVALNRVPFARD